LFTSDSGTTDILLRSSDDSILSDYVPYPDFAAKLGFEVANSSYIYPIAIGLLHIPHTYIALTTYVFNDADLSGNLFGLAPLVNLGYTATYSSDSLFIADDHHQTVIYGTKSPSDNAWRFSLPRHQLHSAHIVVRHEQDAELVLYANASLSFPTYKTMFHATNMGWLINYPGLTPKALRRNKPQSPATGLGHITTSRSNVRSTRSVQDPLTSSSPHFISLARAQPPDDSPLEHLDHYDITDLPDIVLRCSLRPSSDF
jgi:hypothetical protein